MITTITALAVQCWMNRIVDRIEQLEFRVNDSDPQDYELIRTPNGPAHYEIIRKPANWSDWLPSHPDLPVYEATRRGVRPGMTVFFHRPRGWDQRRMDELAEGLSQGWRQRAGNGVWERVTRLDVIRPLPEGRSSETTDGAEWALQDDGRTLKIWTDGRWRDRQKGASHE